MLAGGLNWFARIVAPRQVEIAGHDQNQHSADKLQREEEETADTFGGFNRPARATSSVVGFAARHQ